MLPDLNIRSWREIFTGEFRYSGMLVVSLLGLNCRFWSHLGCLGWKVLYLPIQVSLSTGHKEISKKECPDTDHPGGGWGWGGGCTPMNSCSGCAAGSPHLYPFSDQNKSHPFSDLASKIHTRFQTWQR